MRIRAGYELAYDCPTPTPMVLCLSVHPSRQKDLVGRQDIQFSPNVEATDYLDGFGNVCTRILAPAGRVTISSAFEIEDSGRPDAVNWDAIQHPVEDLPSDVLVYLLGSRYCATDRLSETAWGLFGHVPAGWQRVQAIVDFTHDHVEFGYHHARSTKTAWDAHQEQQGVCRDFAHLAITLCRCMNIPARYTTGYLGDIGVPPVPSPMDFSAWFEVFLGDRWYTSDARHNVRRIGRIVMARGRDAGDVPITMCFGPSSLLRFDVVTDEVVDPKAAAVAA